MLAGDRSQGVADKVLAHILFDVTSAHLRVILILEKVEITVIIAHLTWHFANTSGHFDFLYLA